MKQLKLLISLAVIVLLSGLILATASNKAFQPNATEQTPQPQLQVYSPQDNGTYQTVNVPLNITANNATAKITYSLDGAENVTFSENTTATSSLPNGVHNITVFGFDSEGKLGDSKNVTFIVKIPYPPTLKLTTLQVQATIGYFEAMGLNVQVLDTSKPQNCLYASSVDVESKEELANFAIANRINVIYEVLDSNYVGFCAHYYDNSWLPIVYTYSVTVY
jgi:hypothetical protein